jgi:hypothetical protein
MRSRPTPVIAEQPTPSPPTPSPSSATVANDRVGGLGVTSTEELPRELRDDPFVACLMRMTPDQEAYLANRSAAAEEGRRLYGDESSDAWLAALLGGTHPLCRVPEPPRH